MPTADLEQAARLVSEFVGDFCVIAQASEDRRRLGPFTVHSQDPAREEAILGLLARANPERAKDTPFGGTIAHGYYTLSLAPKLSDEILKMDGFAFAVNYGLNKVRFPAPVPVDSRIRMRAKLAGLEDIPGGAQMVMELTFEREGGEKPVCVAQSVVRVYEGG